MQLGYCASSLYIDLVSGWRYMYGTSAPIAVIMGIGMWWLPPSPRWLLLCAIQGKGNLQDVRQYAICCLCRLRGRSVDDSAAEQINEILIELSYSDEEKEASIWEVFQGKCLKALIIGAGLVFFQQVPLLSLNKLAFFSLCRCHGYVSVISGSYDVFSMILSVFFTISVCLIMLLVANSCPKISLLLKVTGQPSVLYYAATILKVILSLN